MKLGLKVLLFLGIIAICVITLRLFFYERTYVPSQVRKPSYEDITAMPTPHPAKFTDVYREAKGVVVVDLAHDNNFTLAELNPLRLRLVSRGFDVEYLQKEEEAKKCEKKEDSFSLPLVCASVPIDKSKKPCYFFYSTQVHSRCITATYT